MLEISKLSLQFDVRRLEQGEITEAELKQKAEDTVSSRHLLRKYIRKESIEQYGFMLTEIGTLKRGEDVVRADGTVISHLEAAYKPYVPRSYAYVSDTAVFHGEAEVLEGVTVIYHETTFLQEHEEKAAARFHSTTHQAAQVALDAGASKLIIGHYSSRNTDHRLYEAECREVFPESYAASDGDVFEI